MWEGGSRGRGHMFKKNNKTSSIFSRLQKILFHSPSRQVKNCDFVFTSQYIQNLSFIPSSKKSVGYAI